MNLQAEWTSKWTPENTNISDISTGEGGGQDVLERQLSIGLERSSLLKVLVFIMFFSTFVYKMCKFYVFSAFNNCINSL